jgi:hypothetical protein
LKRIVLVSFDPVSDPFVDELSMLLEGSRHRIIALRLSNPGAVISVSQPVEDWTELDQFISGADPGECKDDIRTTGAAPPMRNPAPISPALLRDKEITAINLMLESILEGDLVITFLEAGFKDSPIPACYFSSVVMKKMAFSLCMVIKRGPIVSIERVEELNRLYLDLGMHFHCVVGLSPVIHAQRRVLELSHLLRHLGDLVFRPGVINLDLADLLVTSKGGTVLVMTWGLAQPGSRAAKTSIRNAIGNPLCDVDLATVRKALIHVVSNQDMTLQDSLVATEFLRTKIKETARIIWGVTLVDDPEEDMEVMIIMATTPMELLIHWYNREI